MQIARWGNSLAIRLPVELLRDLDLKEGDEVKLRRVSSGELAVIVEQERRTALMDHLRTLAIQFPDDFKFDREEANAR